MKYIFTQSANALVVTTDTESGRFPAEIKTYTGASADLANDRIYLREYGRPEQEFKLHELRTIDGVQYTTLALAFHAILTLITSASVSGSIPSGSLTEYNTPTNYDTVEDLPLSFPAKTIHQISILSKTGNTTITVDGEVSVLEEGQTTVIPADGLIDVVISIDSCTGAFLATTIT